jgi:3,4-dihydroxy 2-butanone 4-phosphate synthase/GTP cyclohydrolase II
MTNNPDKVRQLEAYGLTVAERIPIEVAPRKSNRDYLRTKRTKFGHLLSLVAEKRDPGSRIQDSGKRRK